MPALIVAFRLAIQSENFRLFAMHDKERPRGTFEACGFSDVSNSLVVFRMTTGTWMCPYCTPSGLCITWAVTASSPTLSPQYEANYFHSFSDHSFRTGFCSRQALLYLGLLKQESFLLNPALLIKAYRVMSPRLLYSSMKFQLLDSHLCS